MTALCISFVASSLRTGIHSFWLCEYRWISVEEELGEVHLGIFRNDHGTILARNIRSSCTNGPKERQERHEKFHRIRRLGGHKNFTSSLGIPTRCKVSSSMQIGRYRYGVSSAIRSKNHDTFPLERFQRSSSTLLAARGGD